MKDFQACLNEVHPPPLPLHVPPPSPLTPQPGKRHHFLAAPVKRCCCLRRLFLRRFTENKTQLYNCQCARRHCARRGCRCRSTASRSAPAAKNARAPHALSQLAPSLLPVESVRACYCCLLNTCMYASEIATIWGRTSCMCKSCSSYLRACDEDNGSSRQPDVTHAQ